MIVANRRVGNVNSDNKSEYSTVQGLCFAVGQCDELIHTKHQNERCYSQLAEKSKYSFVDFKTARDPSRGTGFRHLVTQPEVMPAPVKEDVSSVVE